MPKVKSKLRFLPLLGFGILAAGMAGCNGPDPGSEEELRMISQGCQTRYTGRAYNACVQGTAFARETGNCGDAKKHCADTYDLSLASDPMAEADVFAACWTAARAYMNQRHGRLCLE